MAQILKLPRAALTELTLGKFIVPSREEFQERSRASQRWEKVPV
jgi:hypothetical protein